MEVAVVKNEELEKQYWDLSEHIRTWVKNNPWYKVDTVTNQLRLEQSFGPHIEMITSSLERQNQYKLRRQVFDCYDQLMAKCRQIDLVCRNGCRSTTEMLELEFLRSKAFAAATELVEVLELVRPHIEMIPKGQDDNKPQDNSGDCYITFAQAAEILCVGKSTVSYWADKGKIRDNGQKGQKRRLLKSDILLLKHEHEATEMMEDVRELAAEARRIPRRH